MTVFSISELVDLLNGECSYYEIKSFRKLLSKRHDLKHLSQKDIFSKIDVKTIFCALTGREFDDYTHKRDKNDFITGGPIVRIDLSSELSWIEKYHDRIVKDFSVSRDGSSSLAFICEGGFLHTSSEEPFYFSLRSGANILIGDRGTGKSTVMTLIGLLCDSTTERTGILIKEALRHKITKSDSIPNTDLLIADSSYQGSDDTINLRRIKDTLDRYGISRYVSIFSFNENIFAFFIEPKKGFDIYELNEQWVRVPEDIFVRFPFFPVFRQGDIFRISDSEDRFAFSQLLDALNPTLFKLRRDIVDIYVGIANRNNIKKIPDIAINSPWIRDFTWREFKKLDSLKEHKDVELLLNDTISFLEDAIFNTKAYRYDSDEIKLKDLLERPEDHAYYFTYGTISGLLTKNLSKLRRLQSKLPAGAIRTQYVIQKEVEYMCRQAIEILRTRILALRTVLESCNKLPQINMIDKNLIKGIENALSLRSDLLSIQNIECKKITKSLQDIGVDVEIQSDSKVATDSFLNEEIDLINTAEELYKKLIKLPIFVRLGDLRILTSKLRRISNILKRFETLNTIESDEKAKEIAHIPIIVRLRQGKEFRIFDKLSFGQKAGIILMTVIKNTDADFLFIDQPEDHLDVDTTINLLTPTLRQVSQDKAVLIATHSENLVFGFPEDEITVMESAGEYGIISANGNLGKIEVANEILNTLVGGRRAFCKKLTVYSEFNKTIKCSE